MGILAKSINLCQYRVDGDLPAGDIFPWAAERLVSKKFRPIDHSADEFSIGWVQLDEQENTEFTAAEGWRKDHYLVFSLRRDQRRLPAILLRTHLNKACNEYLSAHPGLRQIPKQKKAEIRDSVVGTLLARTFPVPSTFDVVWDTRNGIVTFASLNAKVLELFESLFTTTFDGLRLIPVHPFARAEGVVDESGQAALASANRARTDAVIELIGENRWLGRDFLLWTAFQTRNGSSEYAADQPGPFPTGEPFIAYLDNRLVLLAGMESGFQKITVAGPQDLFNEVRTALQSGKDITEATFFLERGEDIWNLTLKGETFHFASFRSPNIHLEKDEQMDPVNEREAAFFEKMGLLEGGLQLLDSLYSAFLKERLSTEWTATERLIKAWIGGEE